MSNSMHSSSESRGGVSPVLVGLAVGALLFGFMLCTLGVVAAPLFGDRLLAAAPRPERSWTPPVPTNTPTPRPTNTPFPSQPTGGQGKVSFQPGDKVVNVNDGPVNLRRTPGYLNKPASDRVALVPPKAILTVLDGPQKADGLTWWYVRWDAKNKEGWMAETRASGVRILAPKE